MNCLRPGGASALLGPAFALASLLLLPACSHDAEHDHAEHAHHADHADHADADHADADHAGHAHVAMRGGRLLELGDHFAHVELLHDAETGELTLWLLDAEAESAVRTDMDHVRVRIDGVPEPLTLEPRASALSGETAGDTSEFGGTFEALVGRSSFSGSVIALVVYERSFVDTEFRYPGDP